MGERKVVLLSSEKLGLGDDKLGGLLMANFLRLLGEDDRHPAMICLLNSGVNLVTGGHVCLDHMRRLESLGTTILICKTCLEYMDLEDKVAVGKVSNMKEIQSQLIQGDAMTL